MKIIAIFRSLAAAITSSSPANRAARLNDRGRARLCGGNDSIGEREERVRGNDTAFEREPASFAFQAEILAESTRDIWPAPMPIVRSLLA